MPNQPRRLSRAEVKQLRTFINAVRAVFGQDPLKFTKESKRKFLKKDEDDDTVYSGPEIYIWHEGSGNRMPYAERM